MRHDLLSHCITLPYRLRHIAVKTPLHHKCLRIRLKIRRTENFPNEIGCVIRHGKRRLGGEDLVEELGLEFLLTFN
jgi:hypothetical protein